jgi:hypothetical protein
VIVALKTTISKQRIEMIEQQAIAQAKRRGLRVVNVMTGESEMREEREEE